MNMIHDRDDGSHADAIEVLTHLFADRIRSWGYDPDGSGPEDVAEAVSVAVVDAALVWLEAVDPAELLSDRRLRLMTITRFDEAPDPGK